jgi:hypothetical protein
MNKIDDILNSLQRQQPVITDGLALTDSIMARLDSHAALPDSPESFMLSAVRIVLTMAAAWLVGLFIYQQLTDEGALQGSTSYAADQSRAQALKDAYLRSMQKERQQTLSYTFVKKYINEKR